MSEEQAVARRPLRGVIALLLAALLLVPAVAAFLLLKKPAPIDVGVRFTAGDTLRFHMVMDVSGVTLSGTSPTPAEDEIQADLSWRVVSVDETGAARVVQTLTNPTMRSNGLPVTLADLPPTTMTIGADGRITTTRSAHLFSVGAPGPAQAGIGRLLAFSPGHDVRPGDLWSTQVSQTLWGSALSYGATSTFLRREALGTTDAAVIESDATIPVDLTVKVSALAGAIALPTGLIPKEATASFVGSLDHTATTSWIDPADGSLLKTISRGNFSLKLSLHGFPASALKGNGTGDLSGQLSVQLVRF